MQYIPIRTLPRVGRPAKLSNRTRRVLIREVTKNLMISLTQVQKFSVEMGEPAGRTNILVRLSQVC